MFTVQCYIFNRYLFLKTWKYKIHYMFSDINETIDVWADFLKINFLLIFWNLHEENQCVFSLHFIFIVFLLSNKHTHKMSIIDTYLHQEKYLRKSKEKPCVVLKCVNLGPSWCFHPPAKNLKRSLLYNSALLTILLEFLFTINI